jgi:hypothetical protein
MKLAFDGGGNAATNTSRAYWTESLTDFYLRVYIYIETLAVPAWDLMQIIKMDDLGAGASWRIRIERQGGTVAQLNWQVDGTGLTAGDSEISDLRGAWHRIEVHWVGGTGANGGLVVRVDGAQIYSELDNDFTAYQVESIKIGAPEQTWVPTDGSLLYFDDIGWSDVDWLGEAAAGGGTDVEAALQGARGVLQTPSLLMSTGKNVAGGLVSGTTVLGELAYAGQPSISWIPHVSKVMVFE